MINKIRFLTIIVSNKCIIWSNISSEFCISTWKLKQGYLIPVSIIEWNKCLEMEFQSSLRIQCFGSMPSFKTSVFAKDDHQGWTANCCKFRWNNLDIINVFPKKEKFCFPAKYIGIKPSYSWGKKEPPLLKWQLPQLLVNLIKSRCKG